MVHVGQAEGLTCAQTRADNATAARAELVQLWPSAMVVVVVQDTAMRLAR